MPEGEYFFPGGASILDTGEVVLLEKNNMKTLIVILASQKELL